MKNFNKVNIYLYLYNNVDFVCLKQSLIYYDTFNALTNLIIYIYTTARNHYDDDDDYTVAGPVRGILSGSGLAPSLTAGTTGLCNAA